MAIPTVNDCIQAGRALMGRGDLPGAAQAFKGALGADPLNPQALHMLGWVTFLQGREVEGIELMDRAVSNAPRVGAFHGNLGEAYRRCGRIDEALASLWRASVLSPNSPETWHNLGLVYAEKLDYPRAIECYSRAIGFRPDYANAFFSRALARLSIGEYAIGFEDYEWRWRTVPFAHQIRNFPQPRWGGEALAGRTLLVWAEQGFGDTIMAARLMPMIAGMGAKVVCEISKDLCSLLKVSELDAEIVQRGDPLPAFDCHVPMMSLWRLLKLSVESLPTTLPKYLAGGWKGLNGAYLRASPDAAWVERIPDTPGVLKVGIVWAGQPQHINDRNRSCPPAELGMLDEVAGVAFFSLQKQGSPEGLPLEVTNLAEHLLDFAASAAAIARLDVVVTVDTSVAHLAGALGKDTIVMLPYCNDWRWLVGRNDSPFYPSLRLVRQTSRGDWGGVMKRVVALLIERVRHKISMGAS